MATIKKILLISTITISTLLLLASCSSNSSSETTNDSKDKSVTTKSKSKSHSKKNIDSKLLGSWQANAQDILQSKTANLGGIQNLECTGILTVTFTENKISGQGDVVCTSTLSPISSDGKIDWNCDMTGDSKTLNLTNCVSAGELNLLGQSLPMPETIKDGQQRYSISGNQLTLSFDDESIGTVDQVYTRTS